LTSQETKKWHFCGTEGSYAASSKQCQAGKAAATTGASEQQVRDMHRHGLVYQLSQTLPCSLKLFFNHEILFFFHNISA
jgi:hypothetical protein